MKLITFFKRHIFIIVLAFIFGGLMVAPLIYYQLKLGSNYRGVEPQLVDDELLYLARERDVIDGYHKLSNPYIWEHKNGLPEQILLPENVLALPLKLFNINVTAGRRIYNFLLPALAFILTYAAIYLVGHSRFWAAIFTLFLFWDLFLFKFMRPVSPQFNFVFWLTQLALLWLLIEKRWDRGLVFWNALNLGLLFYIYPYYWTFYLAFMVLLAIVYFVYERNLSFKILKIIIGGLAIGAPYLYYSYNYVSQSDYRETITRLGLIYSHFPSGIVSVFWAAVVFFLFLVSLKKKLILLDVKSLFFFTGLVSAVAVLNQHIVTGKNLEFSSHYLMPISFFLILAFAYLWPRFIKDNPYYTKVVKGLIILVFLAIAVIQALKYKNNLVATANDDYIQRYGVIFEWLRKNTSRDSVVYANEDLSELIPVYTPNNVFYARNANLFLMSDQEVTDRFILNNFFENFSEDFIKASERSIYGVRYVDEYGHIVQGNKLRRLLGLVTKSTDRFPQGAVQTVMNRTNELKKHNLAVNLTGYRIDYFVWDKNKNPAWQLSKQKFLKKLFEDENFAIFVK